MSAAVWQVSGGPASRAYAEVFLQQILQELGLGDAVRVESERPGT